MSVGYSLAKPFRRDSNSEYRRFVSVICNSMRRAPSESSCNKSVSGPYPCTDDVGYIRRCGAFSGLNGIHDLKESLTQPYWRNRITNKNLHVIPGMEVLVPPAAEVHLVRALGMGRVRWRKTTRPSVCLTYRCD